MSLTRFLDAISRLIPGTPLTGREEAIATLDPEKFYVENVRSVLGVSHDSALRICETAVRQGVFLRRVEVLCPDGTVAASAGSEAELPEIVSCWTEEDGHCEEVTRPVKELRKRESYKLDEKAASVLYR